MNMDKNLFQDNIFSGDLSNKCTDDFEECADKYKNDLLSRDSCTKEIACTSETASKKIVPIFGKKKKGNTKTKFLPPVQVEKPNPAVTSDSTKDESNIREQESQESQENTKNGVVISVPQLDSPPIILSSHFNIENPLPIYKDFEKEDTFNNIGTEPNLEQKENFFEKIHNLSRSLSESLQFNTIEHTIQKPIRSNSKKGFGGLICDSLNVLNEDDDVLEYNLSKQLSDINIVNLEERKESNVSVLLLEKVYKNLDCKSYENVKEVLDITKHVIPTDDEYLKLFETIPNLKKKEKCVPMSIVLGDVGFNVKYSDLVKTNKVTLEQNEGDVLDTINLITKMYPVENKVFIDTYKKVGRKK